MMLHVNIDVIGKYLFNMPAPATLEMVSYYYMAAVAALPLAALERKGSLVYVELFYSMMPAWLKRGVLPFALTTATLYCGAAAYAAWEPAINAYRVGAYVGSSVTVSTWPTRFIPVIGFGLLAIMLVWKTVSILVRGVTTCDEAGEAEEDA
jgi:TRAP-type C4-dicarboxylate transport system permease small subunit